MTSMKAGKDKRVSTQPEHTVREAPRAECPPSTHIGPTVQLTPCTAASFNTLCLWMGARSKLSPLPGEWCHGLGREMGQEEMENIHTANEGAVQRRISKAT